MITREVKQAKIEAFGAALAVGEVLIIANNAGLTAAEMEKLRAEAVACGGKAQVVKNTLAKRALDGGGFQSIVDELTGPIVYGTGADITALAKVFVNTAKGNPKLVIRGGVLAGREKISESGVGTLASLPAKPQLLAQLLGTMQAPIAKFVQTANEIPTRAARALAALRDKREE